MKRHTIKAALALTDKIADLENHKQEVEAAIELYKRAERGFPGIMLSSMPHYQNTINLKDEFLVLDTESQIKIYLAKIEKLQQEYEAQLDALQDTPEPPTAGEQNEYVKKDIGYEDQ